jgi:hypothetical protein
VRTPAAGVDVLGVERSALDVRRCRRGTAKTPGSQGEKRFDHGRVGSLARSASRVEPPSREDAKEREVRRRVRTPAAG